MEEEQPSRIGRRLAAIVAADVAGNSRLMGLDEVGTARTLREHRKVTDALLAKHGGRIVKTTGDGVLLEFPSLVDAVDCASGDAPEERSGPAGLHSIQASPFAAFVMQPMRGATIQPSVPDATAALRACDWPGCPRGEGFGTPVAY